MFQILFRFIVGFLWEAILPRFLPHYGRFEGEQVCKMLWSIDAEIGIEKGKVRGPSVSFGSGRAGPKYRWKWGTTNEQTQGQRKQIKQFELHLEVEVSSLWSNIGFESIQNVLECDSGVACGGMEIKLVKKTPGAWKGNASSQYVSTIWRPLFF